MKKPVDGKYNKSTYLIRYISLSEHLAAGVMHCVCVLDTTIATGTDDKLGLVVKATLQHEVCGYTAGMEAYTDVKGADKVVHVALK